MARIDTLANFLTDVSTAIKSKTGKTDPITPANFDTEINSISVGSGGSNGSDVSGTPNNLPKGYTPIEYVSATGSQYIDTGFKPTEKTDFEVTFVSHNGFSSNQGSIFGTRYTYNSQAYHLCTFDSRDNVKTGVGCFIFGSQFYTAFMKTDGSKQSISLINGLYTGGDGTTTDLSSVTTTPNDNLYLFAARDTLGNSIIDYGSLDLYECSFSENGVKIRDFKPAIQDSDGAVGLIDLVNNVFYPSNSATPLIAGPELSVSDLSLQKKSLTVTKNGTYTITYDNNYHGLDSVELCVNIDDYITDCSNLFDTNSGMTASKINRFLPVCKPVTAYKMFFENLYVLQGEDSSVKVNINLLDTSNCESFESMFEYTDPSDFDFSNGLDTSKAVNMQAMFCRANTNTLDLTFINDTSRVTNMSWMFYNVRNLVTLDLSTFDFSNVTSTGSMFSSTGANLSTPTTVYVKDEASQQFILNLPTTDRPSSWSTSNVIVKTTE